MRSEKDIEQSLKDSDLGIEINAGTDRAILNNLVQTHRALQRTTPWRGVLKLAAAAIIVASALLIKQAIVHNQQRTAVGRPGAPNLISLNIAYRRGGMDAVDEQYRKASRTPETRLKRVSLEALLAEMTTNGES